MEKELIRGAIAVLERTIQSNKEILYNTREGLKKYYYERDDYEELMRQTNEVHCKAIKECAAGIVVLREKLEMT